MATLYKSVNVICPFYVSDNAMEIHCEGIFSRTVCKHRFREIGTKDSMFEKYCCSYAWETCKVAQLLKMKYE